MSDRRRASLFLLALGAITLALRLCHSRILWVDEDYHLAAAIQTLHGKMLYRDLWYDKPPLGAWTYALIGGVWGWPLRLFDALYVLALCAALFRFARDLWGAREAYFAAGMAAFFLNFDFAFAVIPVAPDFFMMLPHIAAVHCAWRGRAFGAGVWSGIAFLFHTKGALVLAMCALLAWRGLPLVLAGFLIPSGAALAALAAGGAVGDYGRQVWQWGAAYAGSSPLVDPIANAFRRTFDWLAFHAVLALGAARFWWRGQRRERLWIAAWAALSFAGVALGARFSPRYFFQLLPPLVLASARAWAVATSVPGARRKWAVAVLALAALAPAVRFGPRYATLARDLMLHRPHHWSDLALDQDSQAVAAQVNARKRPASTLFVWGYRPDVFVYTRLRAASRFWDSQPLTGVPADRHLTSAESIAPEWAAQNRVELTVSQPTFIVDSLSLANPRLALDSNPGLRAWLKDYRVVGRTSLSLIYEINETALPPPAGLPPPPPRR